MLRSFRADRWLRETRVSDRSAEASNLPYSSAGSWERASETGLAQRASLKATSRRIRAACELRRAILDGGNMPELSLPFITVEDALARIVAWLRNPNRDAHAVNREPISSELDLRAVVDAVFSDQVRVHQAAHPTQGMTMYRHNYADPGLGAYHAAAWDLCRRGIIHPKPTVDAQYPSLPGWFFVVTPYGRTWLETVSGLDVLPSEYSRFAQLLAGHTGRFGSGFGSRAQEAVRCYRAQTYLACCVMCGAAAESVLLALAVAKTGDEARVLSEYRSASGRSRIERLLLGQQTQGVRDAFAMYTELLKYWRDDAAHGMQVTIDEEDAFTALILLMRFARYADAHWSQLTA